MDITKCNKVIILLQMTVSVMMLAVFAQYDVEMAADTIHVHCKWKRII